MNDKFTIQKADKIGRNVTVRLSTPLAERLDETALRLNWSRSKLIEEALEIALERLVFDEE